MIADVYVYVPSANAAELTTALWALSDPNPTRGTTGMFEVVLALDDSTWLRVNPAYSIPVWEAATLGEIIPGILQPWIDEGRLSAGTIETLAGYIVSMRGQRLVVYAAFPALFKLADEINPTGLGRTKEQMIKEGRLSTPSIP